MPNCQPEAIIAKCRRFSACSLGKYAVSPGQRHDLPNLQKRQTEHLHAQRIGIRRAASEKESPPNDRQFPATRKANATYRICSAGAFWPGMMHPRSSDRVAREAIDDALA